MKPTLYYAANTCARASVIALEEAGAQANYVRVDLAAGEARSPEYLKLNPKGRVPVLVTVRGTLTESVAILAWIAQTWPRSNLVPLDDPWALAQVNSFNTFLSGTLHGIGFSGVFRSARFADGEPAQAAVRARALQTVAETLTLIEHKLGDGWVHGNGFTTSDAYLGVLYRWLDHIDQDLGSFPKIAALSARVFARPSAQRALAVEQA